MAAKEISVRNYVVQLSGEERQELEALIRKRKGPAHPLLKARILLKADQLPDRGVEAQNGLVRDNRACVAPLADAAIIDMIVEREIEPTTAKIS